MGNPVRFQVDLVQNNIFFEHEQSSENNGKSVIIHSMHLSFKSINKIFLPISAVCLYNKQKNHFSEPTTSTPLLLAWQFVFTFTNIFLDRMNLDCESCLHPALLVSSILKCANNMMAQILRNKVCPMAFCTFFLPVILCSLIRSLDMCVFGV